MFRKFCLFPDFVVFHNFYILSHFVVFHKFYLFPDFVVLRKFDILPHFEVFHKFYLFPDFVVPATFIYYPTSWCFATFTYYLNWLSFRSTWVHSGFKCGSCYSIFSFMCMFCRSLFVLLYFFFWPLCYICTSSIYGFWLPPWYLQTLLHGVPILLRITPLCVIPQVWPITQL
jgi:hypothetical protein